MVDLSICLCFIRSSRGPPFTGSQSSPMYWLLWRCHRSRCFAANKMSRKKWKNSGKNIFKKKVQYVYQYENNMKIYKANLQQNKIYERRVLWFCWMYFTCPFAKKPRLWNNPKETFQMGRPITKTNKPKAYKVIGRQPVAFKTDHSDFFTPSGSRW